MAILSDHQDHWIHGNREERWLILAILAMITLSPFIMMLLRG